jgi:threonine synthase
VPIGNAGNITAVMSGFLKFHAAGVIDSLPKIVGVQSRHANPVFSYYAESDPRKRTFRPMTVRPSVAQAAMIGNPVSMPRVIHLVDRYNRTAGETRTFFVEVSEQEIMDWELTANRHGHIACTHGGESLAGLKRAKANGYVSADEVAIVDSTAHALKFSGFQEMYFSDGFPDEFEVTPKAELQNAPIYVHPQELEAVPAPGKPLRGEAFQRFVSAVAGEIAGQLALKRR